MPDIHGQVPRASIRSSVILSLKVSMHCQKPSQRRVISLRSPISRANGCPRVRRLPVCSRIFRAQHEDPPLIKALIRHCSHVRYQAAWFGMHSMKTLRAANTDKAAIASCAENSAMWLSRGKSDARRHNWPETSARHPVLAHPQQALCDIAVQPVSTKVTRQLSRSLLCSLIFRPLSLNVKSFDIASE